MIRVCMGIFTFGKVLDASTVCCLLPYLFASLADLRPGLCPE